MRKYLKSITRKAWWLIGWSTVYATAACIAKYLSADQQTFENWLSGIQIIWLAISASPLIPGTRLEKWVFEKGK